MKNTEKDSIEKAIEEKFWNVYSCNTSRLSSICRQLAFAEGGICWFFFSKCSSVPISIDIKLILTFLLLFFVADAGQYFVLAINNKAQGEFYEDMLEKKLITDREQIRRPVKINSSGNFCFGLKLFLIVIASVLLIGRFYYYQ